jgi:hypothetical protein
MEDTPERRGTIRESNEKLDSAVNHLSDVLDHLRIRDVSHDVNLQLTGVRQGITLSFLVVWCAIVTLFALIFVHDREAHRIATDLQISQLKVLDLQHELESLIEREKVEHGEDHEPIKKLEK